MFDNMFETKKTLIVVYKDEMLFNQLRKMVETNDDSEDSVVGTKDGSINIVGWTEKVWLDNKKAGTINDKILFLGSLKGTESLIPTLDMKFNSFGAYFGISGNQAVLYADSKVLSAPNDYNAFIKRLTLLPVPEIIKRTPSGSEAQGEASYKGIFDAAKGTLFKAASKIDLKKNELFRKKAIIERQQLFFGLNTLYNDYLEDYMNL